MRLKVSQKARCRLSQSREMITEGPVLATPKLNSFVPVAVLLVMVMILVMTASVPMTVAMIAAAVLVTRHVFVVVPIVAHKVDPPAAGVVLRAMLCPVFLVARWNVQVDRRS